MFSYNHGYYVIDPRNKNNCLYTYDLCFFYNYYNKDHLSVSLNRMQYKDWISLMPDVMENEKWISRYSRFPNRWYYTKLTNLINKEEAYSQARCNKTAFNRIKKALS